MNIFLLLYYNSLPFIDSSFHYFKIFSYFQSCGKNEKLLCFDSFAYLLLFDKLWSFRFHFPKYTKDNSCVQKGTKIETILLIQMIKLAYENQFINNLIILNRNFINFGFNGRKYIFLTLFGKLHFTLKHEILLLIICITDHS